MNELEVVNDTGVICFNEDNIMSERFPSIQALGAFIDNFFVACQSSGKTPSLANLAVALRCSREDIIDYEGDPSVEAVIEYAKTRIAATMESRILDEKGTHTGEVFLLKANHGYTEKSVTETNVTGGLESLVHIQVPQRVTEESLTVAANKERLASSL